MVLYMYMIPVWKSPSVYVIFTSLVLMVQRIATAKFVKSFGASVSEGLKTICILMHRGCHFPTCQISSPL